MSGSSEQTTEPAPDCPKCGRCGCTRRWPEGSATVGLPDSQVTMITMDGGAVVTVNAAMALPVRYYPNAATTWIELVGTEGTVMIGDSHKEIIHNTSEHGVHFPLSSMPGEYVEDTYAGPMERETIHFLEAIVNDTDVMVPPATPAR